MNSRGSINNNGHARNNTVNSSNSNTPRSTRPSATGSNRSPRRDRLPQQPQQQQQEQRQKQNEPQQQQQRQQQAEPQEGEAVVTPELLVDALSGHEDGLLAIAERLMEHYDQGYDVMGEAIIDAFADVQKLFQHVVEAAHMEGAAFEASRREEEASEMRKHNSSGGSGGVDASGGAGDENNLSQPSPTAANGMPTRHDEFIDQDVKDLLSEAIRKGATLREADKHMECYKVYEAACSNASSLLPVDSDHRGRLQLSIARAEAMTADRACAILRYAMDDVLRSGLRAGKAPLPDQSKRSDCVLSKPKEHPSLNGTAAHAGVVQSSEEALASLVEEMKEILGAPVYENTPLQDVARRFWRALGDAQRSQLKNEEKLEHNLGKLKVEYLLARAVRTDRVVLRSILPMLDGLVMLLA